jgi:hypothetical protein
MAALAYLCRAFVRRCANALFLFFFMKKTFLSLFFCYLAMANLFAQNLTWGRANVAKKASCYLSNMLGEYEGKYYLTMHVGKNVYIQMYSKDKLLLEKETQLLESFDKVKMRLIDVLRLQDKLFVLYSAFDARNKQTRVYIVGYNMQLEMTSKPREVANVRTQFLDYEGEWFVKPSPDGSKIAFFAIHKINAEEMQKMSVHIYDNQMQYITQKEWEFSHVNELLHLERLAIDNDANVYALAKLYKEKAKERRKGLVNYTLEMFALKNDGQKFNQSISFGAISYLKDMSLVIDNKNTVRALGFYGDNARQDITKGFFSVTYTQNLEVVKKSQKMFDLDLMAKFSPSVQVKQNGLYAFDIKRVSMQEDGALVVFAESSFLKNSTYVVPVPTFGVFFVRDVVPHDHDIMWIKIDADNNVTDIKKIAKKQQSKSPMLHSFANYYPAHSDDVYTLFNDNPKNLAADNLKPAKMSINNMALVFVKTDKNGNMSKSFLQMRHPMGFSTYIRQSQQINPTEMLIFARNEKVYTLGIIDFSKPPKDNK